ncbi:MAG TPA: HAD-IG family 5'-nucleotidase [Acidimicrobiia bacterium]|nr:HAD-IG family 5'-nucleotidase [Acidimicrobiia bacterium]
MTNGPVAPERRIFVNRTLNMRSIRAIGYDMDYTLIHYRVDEWERLAYDHARRNLAALGWPVEALVFDAGEVIRGLALDLELGNLLKATRFGYVIRAAHGTRMLDYKEVRRVYAGVTVDLAEPRFVFLNTLFSLSEAALFGQLVDLMDAGEVPASHGYRGLYATVLRALDEAHSMGMLKQEIAADPDRFVLPDPGVVPALLDQLQAGKRLMLITNSEWAYTQRMMNHAIDPDLPAGMTWRDLFEAVIVSAVKPDFFTGSKLLYRVVDEKEGHLSPHSGVLEPGAAYFGGCANQIESSLRLSGDQILYVGDHLFGDVHVSKRELRWRTALILREMESEVAAQRSFADDQARLVRLMAQKAELEQRLASARLDAQRTSLGYATPSNSPATPTEDDLIADLAAVDDELAPLARAAGRLRNKRWGPLMRAGVDKSLFARQVERYADVYTSRVSNFLAVGPYAMLRALRLPLPHD